MVWSLVWNTALLAGITVTGAVAIGFSAAFLVTRCAIPFRRTCFRSWFRLPLRAPDLPDRRHAAGALTIH